MASNAPIFNAAPRTPHEKGSLLTADQKSQQGTIPAATQPASTGQVSERLAGVQKGPVTDTQFAASPEPGPGTQQNADAKGEAISQITVEAPEKKAPALATSPRENQVPAAVPTAASVTEQPTVNTAAASATGSSQPDQVAGGNKGQRIAMGLNGTYGTMRGPTEQTSSKPEVLVENSGSKTASVIGTATFVPSQGSAGQNGFGDAGKNGHSEQKAQTSQGAPIQPQGIGLPATPVGELPQPEVKPENLKSALHESILAQVKDGVVKHDNKGNGQMSIRLNPGELGELKIQVRMDDNRVRIEVHADNSTVKDLLMSNLGSLKDSLSSKNFSMEGFDVSTGGGAFNSPLPDQKESPRQQPLLRSARAGAYPEQTKDAGVNYLTGEVNNLLDVRF